MQEPSLKTTNNSDIHKTINNNRLKAPLLKIILIGDSGVGKTTLIHSFVNNGKLREEFKQSVGIDYIMKKMDLGSKVYVRFEIWDTAGNEKFRTMISSYYRGANGIILLYDSTNIKSFYSLKNWLNEIHQYASETCIKYLVSNKIDIHQEENSVSSSSWTINEEEVQKVVEANKMKLFKVSAYNNIGVQNVFKSMAEDIIKSLDEEKLTLRSESIKLGYLNNQNFNSNSKNTEQNNSNGSNNNSTYFDNQCCKF